MLFHTRIQFAQGGQEIKSKVFIAVGENGGHLLILRQSMTFGLIALPEATRSTNKPHYR